MQNKLFSCTQTSQSKANAVYGVWSNFMVKIKQFATVTIITHVYKTLYYACYRVWCHVHYRLWQPTTAGDVVVTATIKTLAQTLFSFWESLLLPRERKVLLSQHAHTPLFLSLSLCVCVRQLVSVHGSWRAALSVKHRYYFASLILHDASIAVITAKLLSLSSVYLISSDDGSIIRMCAD